MRTQIKAALLTSQVCRGKQKTHDLVLQRIVTWPLAVSAAHLRKAPSICAQTRINTQSSRARKPLASLSTESTIEASQMPQAASKLLRSLTFLQEPFVIQHSDCVHEQ